MYWENYTRIDGYEEYEWSYQVGDRGVIAVSECSTFQDYEKNFQDFFDFEVTLSTT